MQHQIEVPFSLVFLILGLMALSMFLPLAWAYEAIANARRIISDFKGRELQRQIDAELCKHGLSSDKILQALVKLDHFSYVAGGQLCTCRKNKNGLFDFETREATPYELGIEVDEPVTVRIPA